MPWNSLGKKLKRNVVILLLLLLSTLITWPIFLPGYFSHHDDLQVMRVYEMRRCFADLQIPCRWAADMGYGNGFPLFNYYGPFPYYLGALVSFMVGYITAAKLLFLMPTIIGLLSMYLLSAKLFGKGAGFISAILFAYAPYRALDIYVRGAIAESWAISLVPLILYFILNLTEQTSIVNFLTLSVTLAAFLTNHNIMTIFFLPIFILWAIIMYFSTSSRKNVLVMPISFLLGFGLAAYFIIPAFAERNLVQTENLTKLDLDFRAHFVTIKQLFFDRSWGYGASIPGPNDTISFQIGWPHWWLGILTFCLVIAQLIGFKKFRLDKRKLILFLFLVLSLGASMMMTHVRSAPIWEAVRVLRYAQFPWRFLSVTIVTASLMGGLFTSLFEGQARRLLISVILVLTVVLNWSYFRPNQFYFSLTDQEKITGSLWNDQKKAGILDYLPRTAVEPREPAPSVPVVVSGDAVIKDFVIKSDNWQFKSEVMVPATVEVPVFDFPNWRVFVNSSPYPHSHQNYLGRIMVQLEPGTYDISGKLNNTPIRNLANLISLLSILTIILFYAKLKKDHR